MIKKSIKKVSAFVICLTMFLSTTNNALAASATFNSMFVGEKTAVDNFVSKMSSLNTSQYSNMTTGLTVASFDDGNESNYVDFSDLVTDVASKSFLAPFDIGTSTQPICSYTIQGICYNSYNGDTYTLISAYKNNVNSVIFIRKNTETTFTQINIGGRTDHFGGIASGGSYTYLTGENSNSILRIYDNDLFSAYNNATSQNSGNIIRENTLNSSMVDSVYIGYNPEFLTYDSSTDYLWAGNFDKNNGQFMYAFDEDEVRTESSVTSVASMEIPSCTQGASFRNGKLILSRSFVRHPDNSTRYVSELYCYNGPSVDDPLTVYMLPSMAEGVIIGAAYTYIVFESNSYQYTDSILRCKKVLAVRTSDLF